jgi:hypothetical protein
VLHMSVTQEAKQNSVTKQSDASLCHTRCDMTGGVWVMQQPLILPRVLFLILIFLLKEHAPEVASYQVMNLC